jgi:hypothetical protein
MRSLRVAAPPSPLGVSTPRDVAGKDHGHGVVGLPPVLSARLIAQARAEAWPWVIRRQKASVSAGAAFAKAARA